MRPIFAVCLLVCLVRAGLAASAPAASSGSAGAVSSAVAASAASGSSSGSGASVVSGSSGAAASASAAASAGSSSPSASSAGDDDGDGTTLITTTGGNSSRTSRDEVSEPGEFVLHTWIEREVSALRVSEQFVATPVRGHVWRDLLFECRLHNVTGRIDGVVTKVHQELLESGFIRMKLETSAAPGPLVHVRLDYTMVDSVLPVGHSDQFAVILGVPPCSECACPKMSLIQIDVLIPANVSDVSTQMHVPPNMFKSLPLSGTPQPPVLDHTLHTHSFGAKKTSRIAVHGPVSDGKSDLLSHEPIPSTPAPSPDGVAVVVRFTVDELHFHVGVDSCFPSEFITTVLSEGEGSAGGADLMIELGLAIVIVCAGIPCMCGVCCWLWVRVVQKKKAPKARGTGIASFSYGSDGKSFYEIVNHDNEQTIDARQGGSPPNSARLSARSLL